MGKLSDFLALYPKINTRNNYRAAITEYLGCVYNVPKDKGPGGTRAKKITAEVFAKYDDLSNQYFNEGRNYANDLLQYTILLNAKPPLSAKTYLSGVKEFLNYGGVDLSAKTLKSVKNKLPKGRARTLERDLDHEVLSVILAHADLKLKTLVLVLLSSGMRIGEALQLKVSDINLKTHPAEVTIRGGTTKTGVQRYTFISGEAVESLKQWLLEREEYLRSSGSRNAGLIKAGMSKEKKTDDKRVFPFTSSVVKFAWTNTLKKAGVHSLDEETGREQIHVHMTRKFFRSQLALKVPRDIVEALMGHSTYLSDAYRRFTKKQVAEYYLRGEYLLTLSIPPEVMESSAEIKEKLLDQQVALSHLAAKNEQLERELSTLKGFIEVISQNPDVLVNAMKKPEK
jgi:integrase